MGRNERKVSIKLDLKIFLFLFLFLLTSQLEIYIVLIVFAIIHEIGHLIAGLILKFEPEEIKLTPVGLRIQFKVSDEEYKIKNVKSITIKKAIIALAGPITNLIIATTAVLMAKFNINLQNLYIYELIVYSNLLIAMFNLIPIYPMDGGRVVNETLKLVCGNKKAYKITYILSKTILIILTAISSIAILYLQNISIVIILAYLWYLEIAEIRKYNRRKNIEKLVKSMENKEHSVV